MVGSGAYHCRPPSHGSAHPLAMRYDRVLKPRLVLSSILFSIKARTWGLTRELRLLWDRHNGRQRCLPLSQIMVGSGAYHCCPPNHASAQPMRYDSVFKTYSVLSSILFSIKARSWGLKRELRLLWERHNGRQRCLPLLSAKSWFRATNEIQPCLEAGAPSTKEPTNQGEEERTLAVQSGSKERSRSLDTRCCCPCC
jgi:hypothetical protein